MSAIDECIEDSAQSKLDRRLFERVRKYVADKNDLFFKNLSLKCYGQNSQVNFFNGDKRNQFAFTMIEEEIHGTIVKQGPGKGVGIDYVVWWKIWIFSCYWLMWLICEPTLLAWTSMPCTVPWDSEKKGLGLSCQRKTKSQRKQVDIYFCLSSTNITCSDVTCEWSVQKFSLTTALCRSCDISSVDNEVIEL